MNMPPNASAAISPDFQKKKIDFEQSESTVNLVGTSLNTAKHLPGEIIEEEEKEQNVFLVGHSRVVSQAEDMSLLTPGAKTGQLPQQEEGTSEEVADVNVFSFNKNNNENVT